MLRTFLYTLLTAVLCVASWGLGVFTRHGLGLDAKPEPPPYKTEQGRELIIRQGATAIVTVRPDGSVEFHDPPDVAARIFWEAVGRTMPRCPPRFP